MTGYIERNRTRIDVRNVELERRYAMLEWLKQPSTWSTLVMILGAIGYETTVDVVQAACGVIVAVMVFYNLVRKET